jgi:hypothetical protein
VCVLAVVSHRPAQERIRRTSGITGPGIGITCVKARNIETGLGGREDSSKAAGDETQTPPGHPLVPWVNFPLVALMIWSGLWIYWANDVYRIGLGSFTLFRFFPESFYRTFGVSHELAKGMAWHFFFLWFFALNEVVYETTGLSGVMTGTSRFSC